jgi:DinB superfamily
MNYNSIAEIFDDIDRTRARLFQSVEGLSDAQQGFRPAPDKWSVAEVLEHLSLVERRTRSAPPRADRSTERDDGRGTPGDELKASGFQLILHRSCVRVSMRPACDAPARTL